MFNEKLLFEIQKIWNGNTLPVFVLAMSGGPDSLFLGECLSKIFPAENVIVAHFDHGWRKQSEEEVFFCHKWAQKKKLSFVTERWKTPAHSEEKARHARFDFLQRVRKERKADAIVLGNHADDQTETIFFQFLRGSGLRGLRGMRIFEKTQKLFRPFLGIQKQEIICELQKHNIPFCIDASNTDTRFSRNFLRKEILPRLTKRFPFLGNNIRRQAQIFSDALDHIDAEKSDFWKQSVREVGREIRMQKGDFWKQSPFLRGEILRTLFAQKNLDYAHVKNLILFLEKGGNGKKKILRGGEIIIGEQEIFFSFSPPQ